MDKSPYCEVEGCFNLRQGRLCSGHAYQKRAGKPYTQLPTQRTEPWGVPTCTFAGCEKWALQGEHCQSHYAQLKRGESLRPLRRKGESDERYNRKASGEYRERLRSASHSDPFCHVDGCYNHRRSSYYCPGHSKQKKAGEEFTVLRRQKTEPWDVPMCSFDGCEWYSSKKGYCEAHYRQQRLGQELRPLACHSWNGGLPCAFEGCNMAARSAGLCGTHYTQRLNGVELHPINEALPCPVGDCTETYTHRSRVPMCRAHVRVLNVYSLTIERLLEMYKNGSVCAICGQRGPTAIDHDHACCPGDRSCGKCVRGILCINCNHAIGSARDDVDVLYSAIDYLESSRGSLSAVA